MCWKYTKGTIYSDWIPRQKYSPKGLGIDIVVIMKTEFPSIVVLKISSLLIPPSILITVAVLLPVVSHSNLFRPAHSLSSVLLLTNLLHECALSCHRLLIIQHFQEHCQIRLGQYLDQMENTRLIRHILDICLVLDKSSP